MVVFVPTIMMFVGAVLCFYICWKFHVAAEKTCPGDGSAAAIYIGMLAICLLIGSMYFAVIATDTVTDGQFLNHTPRVTQSDSTD